MLELELDRNIGLQNQPISKQANTSYRQLFADKCRQTKSNKNRKAMLFELPVQLEANGSIIIKQYSLA